MVRREGSERSLAHGSNEGVTRHIARKKREKGSVPQLFVANCNDRREIIALERTNEAFEIIEFVRILDRGTRNYITGSFKLLSLQFYFKF